MNLRDSRRALKDLQRGESIDGVYLVEQANFKQARNGKPFIQMMLRDATAAVRGLRWEATREEFGQIERHPFLHVSGRVEEYQGNMQIIVDEMSALSEQDARVKAADFLPRSRYPIEEMERELGELVKSIRDAGLRALIEKILARPGVKQGYLGAPAGKTMHHAYVGGLLEHVLSLARLSRLVVNHYPWLDSDMMMAGVLLHDIGKISELAYETGFSYTDEGQLVGHIPIAISWIDEAAKEVPALDPGKLLEIKHIVTSHHGKLEFGSPKVPMTAEAVALHFLDNLDAKLAAILDNFEASEAMRGAERWSEFNVMLGARLFFPPGLDQRVHAWRASEKPRSKS